MPLDSEPPGQCPPAEAQRGQQLGLTSGRSLTSASLGRPRAAVVGLVPQWGSLTGCRLAAGVQEKLGVMNKGMVYALWSYEAQNSDELSFREGDAITILRRKDEHETEWWWARLGDREGYVPRNLLGVSAQPRRACAGVSWGSDRRCPPRSALCPVGGPAPAQPLSAASPPSPPHPPVSPQSELCSPEQAHWGGGEEGSSLQVQGEGSRAGWSGAGCWRSGCRAGPPGWLTEADPDACLPSCVLGSSPGSERWPEPLRPLPSLPRRLKSTVLTQQNPQCELQAPEAAASRGLSFPVTVTPINAQLPTPVASGSPRVNPGQWPQGRPHAPCPSPAVTRPLLCVLPEPCRLRWAPQHEVLPS